MGSPLWIFKGQTQAQLDELRASALSRIVNGDRTSMSGGGKSTSKTWTLSASEALREIAFAEGKLNGSGSQKVYQDLSRA